MLRLAFRTCCPIGPRRGDQPMMRAFKPYTGPDNASHVLETQSMKDVCTDMIAIHFKETPANSSYDWHPDSEPQFVITPSGTLEVSDSSNKTALAVHRCGSARMTANGMARPRWTAVGEALRKAQGACDAHISALTGYGQHDWDRR